MWKHKMHFHFFFSFLWYVDKNSENHYHFISLYGAPTYLLIMWKCYWTQKSLCLCLCLTQYISFQLILHLCWFICTNRLHKVDIKWHMFLVSMRPNKFFWQFSADIRQIKFWISPKQIYDDSRKYISGSQSWTKYSFIHYPIENFR